METKNNVLQQFVRYFGVALVGYAVDFGLLILFKEVFHQHYLLAATVGFMAGLAITYILSSKYVFGESKFKSKKADFALFSLIGLVGLLLLNLLMWGLTDGIGVNYLASKILATIAVYLWNFFARRALYKN